MGVPHCHKADDVTAVEANTRPISLAAVRLGIIRTTIKENLVSRS